MGSCRLLDHSSLGMPDVSAVAPCCFCSDITAADAAALFQGLVDGSNTAGTANKVQQLQPAVGVGTESNDGASAGSVQAGGGPMFGASHRQSTFMRSVTAQLLHKLEVSATEGISDAQHHPPLELQQPQNMVNSAANKGDIADRPVSSATAYSELSIYDDDDGQEPKQCTTGHFHDPGHGDAAAGVGVTVDGNLGSALQQWQILQQSLPCQQTQETAGMLAASEGLQGEQSAASPAGQHEGNGSHPQASTASSSATPSAPNRCSAENNSSSVGSRSSTATSSSSCSKDSVATGASADGAAIHGVLTPAQFKQALTLLSRSCFRRIGNASRAWKLLMDRHLKPLADRKHSR